MATNHHETNEGVIIAWGILIMLLCLSGASLTGTSFMEFFFVMLFIALDVMVFMAIAIGVFCLFVYAFRRDPDDKRTLLQVFKQEYNHSKLVDHYMLLFRYLGEYMSETESYAYVMRYLGRIERYIFRLLRHPIKTLSGKMLDEEIEAEETTAVAVAKTKSETIETLDEFKDAELPDQAADDSGLNK